MAILSSGSPCCSLAESTLQRHLLEFLFIFLFEISGCLLFYYVSFRFVLLCFVVFFFHNSYYLYCSMNDDRRWQPMLAYSANHISCLWLLNQKTNLSARNSIVKLINWSEPTWIDIPRSLSWNTRCGKEGNTTRNKQPPLPTFWWSVS